VAELVRQVGISQQRLYRWKKQYQGLQSSTLGQFWVFCIQNVLEEFVSGAGL